MRPLRYLAIEVFGVCCGIGALAAQADLGQRIAAAVKTDALSTNPYSETEVGKVADAVPMAAFLDAVVELRPRLTDHELSRLVGALRQRHAAVLAAWQREPDRRRTRGAAFGLVELEWLNRYQDAGAAERRDIEAIARWISPADLGTSNLRGIASDWRAQAATLMREAVRGERDRGAPALATLRLLAADDQQRSKLASLLWQGYVSPFVLGPLLADPDPRLRRRVAIVLWRVVLGSGAEHLPEHLLEGLAADPCAPFRGRPKSTFVPTDARIEAWIAAIETGERPEEAFTYGEHASPALRKKLAKAMLDAALAISLDPSPNPRPLEDWRLACMVHAVRLDPINAVRLLADAVNAVDPQRAVAAVQAAAMYAGEVPAEVALEMAPLVGVLLGNADARVRAGAARLRGIVLAGDPRVPMAELDAADALRVAKAGLGRLEILSIPSGCGTGPERLGGPNGTDATLVLTAATAAETRLAAPLLDALAAVRAAPDRAARKRHEWFVLSCLRELAPHLGAATADALWRAVMKPADAARSRVEITTKGLEFEIAARLLGSVSEPLFVAILAASGAEEKDVWQGVWQYVFRSTAVGHLPLPRLRACLERERLSNPETFGLHRRCPELLAAAWRAGDPRAALAAGALWSINDWQWAEQQRVAGVLPVELLASALARTSTPAAVPLSLLVAVDGHAVCADVLPQRLVSVPPAAADIAAWQQLARSAHVPVALAAVRRLVETGDAGRAAAAAVIEGLLAREDLQVVRDAWWTAVDVGLAVGDRASLERRFAGHRDAGTKICLHAIKLRLDGWPQRELPVNIAAQVLAMAGVDVTPEQLEWVLPAPTKTDAQNLLGSRSVVTQATALLAAAKDPWWDEQLERLVVFYTTNADPRLRGAAYRSLGQRDPDLWASAMLVHVAEFDPDPLVRQEAPRSRR